MAVSQSEHRDCHRHPADSQHHASPQLAFTHIGCCTSLWNGGYDKEQEQEKRYGDDQPAKAEGTAPPLSNRLTDLAERAGEAFRLGRSKEGEANQARRINHLRSLEAAKTHLDCGSMLVEAKAECVHGEWTPFLKKAGIAERSAQRLMKVARSGMSAETIVRKGGLKAAEASLAKPRNPPPVTDLDGQAFPATLPKLKAAAKKGKGIRLSAAEVSALVDAVAWTAPPYGDWNGPEETFVGTGLAKRVLLGLALPGQMGKVLMKLHGAHPGFVPAEELREASGYTPTRFAAMMEVFHWRLVNTDGHDGRERFFDWRHDDDSGVWECRLPDTVRRALEEAFPKYFPAPDNGVDGSGATAGSDADPS